MNYIGIIVNNKKDVNYTYLKRLSSLLVDSGFTPVVLKEYRSVLPDKRFIKASLEEMFKMSSLVITLGGDGTLLNIADIAVKYNVAILGVNLGMLGYLAQLDKAELNRIPEILSGDIKVQNRMMLDVEVHRNGETVYKYSALNDAVVTRSAVLKPISIELYGENGIIADYFCDGLIFSTPTGSSAYSLSVGGPVMDPTMEAILVSAISPHSLSAHSLVFNKDKTLECKAKTGKSGVQE